LAGGKAGRELTLDIGTYTSGQDKIGTTGSVNFNLEYVPFNLTAWNGISSSLFTTASGGKPAWIIRNGVNDAVQNSGTDFAPAVPWDGTKNGNGAVAFTVADGEDNVSIGDYTMRRAWYVASTGADGNAGTSAAPLATVPQALARMKAAYDTVWKKAGDTAYGGIIIQDTVEVSSQIDIDNTGSIYPPILLIDDDSSSGGTLQARESIGSGNRLLNLQNGARVTLAGGLLLRGVAKTHSSNIRIVYVGGSATVFTMNGGIIKFGNAVNVTSSFGGGVVVDGGTFTMDDGQIYDNTAYHGGGVAAANGGTFTMAGGVISGNKAVFYGGGVSAHSGSSFTMAGGVISGNVAIDAGGGVYLSSGSIFVKKPTGGTIYGYDGNMSISNVVRTSTISIRPDRGHAIGAFNSSKKEIYCKEATVNPEDSLGYDETPTPSGAWSLGDWPN
jgi:hypothetical protein